MMQIKLHTVATAQQTTKLCAVLHSFKPLRLMNKSMLPLLLSVICICSTACSKIQLRPTAPPAITKAEEVSRLLAVKAPQQNLLPEKIVQLQSYQYNSHTYTHITYINERQATATMIIESYYNAANQLSYTTYRCDSNFCPCQIIIELSELGEPSISCSCTPCTMTIK